jgi:hypothetical protein
VRTVAVDLEPADPLPADAVDRGRTALDGLGDALLSLGLARLRRGEADDVAELVPAYVSLPRGVEEAAASIAWAPDLR